MSVETIAGNNTIRAKHAVGIWTSSMCDNIASVHSTAVFIAYQVFMPAWRGRQTAVATLSDLV